MLNHKVIFTLIVSLTLVACGSDTKKTPIEVPKIPAGFGDNNDSAVVSSIQGTWVQDCAPIEGNLAKRQEVTLGKKNIQLTIWDYSDSSCSQLVDKNTFSGAYKLIPTTTPVRVGSDVVFPFEVIYTQSTSTPFTAEWVRRRQGFCNRSDWAIGKEIDVSDHSTCAPLFDVPLRKHIRVVRNESDAQNKPVLFLDNQRKGKQLDGYPRELDRSPFKRGSL